MVAGDLRAADVVVADGHGVEAGADPLLLVAAAAQVAARVLTCSFIAEGTARQGVTVLGRDSPAAARLENVAPFSDFVSVLRAAEQVRDVLDTKPAPASDGPAPGAGGQ